MEIKEAIDRVRPDKNCLRKTVRAEDLRTLITFAEQQEDIYKKYQLWHKEAINYRLALEKIVLEVEGDIDEGSEYDRIRNIAKSALSQGMAGEREYCKIPNCPCGGNAIVNHNKL